MKMFLIRGGTIIPIPIPSCCSALYAYANDTMNM